MLDFYRARILNYHLDVDLEAFSSNIGIEIEQHNMIWQMLQVALNVWFLRLSRLKKNYPAIITKTVSFELILHNILHIHIYIKLIEQLC